MAGVHQVRNPHLMVPAPQLSYQYRANCTQAAGNEYLHHISLLGNKGGLFAISLWMVNTQNRTRSVTIFLQSVTSSLYTLWEAATLHSWDVIKIVGVVGLGYVN
jgi:hypothetical protein